MRCAPADKIDAAGLNESSADCLFALVGCGAAGGDGGVVIQRLQRDFCVLFSNVVTIQHCF